MADMLTALRLLISGDSAGAVAAIQEVGAATEEVDAKTAAANETQMKSVTAMGAMTSAAMVTGAGVAGLTAIMGLSIDSYAKWGEAVIKGASLTGMSVESYSKILGELKAFNVNADAGTMAMKFFEKQIYAAETGTKKSVEAFTTLGISMQQVQTMKQADLLALVRDRLSQTSNAAERTALMVQLFGRGATNMTLWAGASADTIAKVDERLKSTGQILDEQHAKQLMTAGKDWLAFKSVLQGLEITLAEEIIPTIGRLIQVFTWLMMEFRPFVWLIPVGAAALSALLIPMLAVISAVKMYEMVTKAFMIAQELATIAQTAFAVATGKVTLQEGIQILTGKNLAVVTATDTTATEAETVATEAQTTAMGAGIVEMGLYCVALAAAVIAIYEVVKAWNEAKQAAQQYQAQVQGFNATAAQNAPEETEFGQLKGAQTMAQINASNAANAYKSPSTMGYAAEAGKRALQWASVAVGQYLLCTGLPAAAASPSASPP